MFNELKKRKCWNSLEVGRWYYVHQLLKTCGMSPHELGMFFRKITVYAEGVLSKRTAYVRDKQAYPTTRKVMLWRKEKDVDFNVLKRLIESGKRNFVREIEVKAENEV